jgi:hypothetical protein
MQHDPSPFDEAVHRLARHLRQQPEIVRSHLGTPGALQGRGPLVRPYRSGLQWNPVDDLCVACTVERVVDGTDRSVRWELLAVSPRSEHA